MSQYPVLNLGRGDRPIIPLAPTQQGIPPVDRYNDGYTAQYPLGYEQGKNAGYQPGYQFGLSGQAYTEPQIAHPAPSTKPDRYEQGADDGFNQGYIKGLTDWYQYGYSQGYAARPITQGLVVSQLQQLSITPQSLELDDHQKPWADRAKEILRNFIGYTDTNELGTGKSYIAMHIAKVYNLKMFVICPKNVKANWIEYLTRYGIPYIDVLTYGELKGVHSDYLDRMEETIEDSSGKQIKEINYSISDYGKRIFAETPILFIVDEFQSIKNKNSHQRNAVAAMIKHIVEVANTSRYGLLSGTPFDNRGSGDKYPGVVNILMVMNIIKKYKKITGPDTGEPGTILYGLSEVIYYCIDVMGLNDVIQPILDEFSVVPQPRSDGKRPLYKTYRRMISADAHALALQLYQAILGATSGYMDTPVYTMIGPNGQEVEVPRIIKNSYYSVGEKNIGKLRRNLDELGAGITKSPDGRWIIDKVVLRVFTRVSKAIEESKVDGLVRNVRGVLDSIPKSKVIIACKYITTLEDCAQQLSGYSPMQYRGNTSDKHRQEYIDRFNNDPRSRLMIIQITSGNAGINLHDTVGDSPRYTFIMSDYVLIPILQIAGRTYRRGVKSPVNIRIVYSKELGGVETNIFDALAAKGDLLNAVTMREIPLPSSYPKHIEGEDPGF